MTNNILDALLTSKAPDKYKKLLWDIIWRVGDYDITVEDYWGMQYSQIILVYPYADVVLEHTGEIDVFVTKTYKNIEGIAAAEVLSKLRAEQ